MKESKKMYSYLIESLAPLVFRSGKPFGSKACAQDVIFPLPSVAAGLVRYLYLSQNNKTFPVDFYGEAYQDLLKIQSFGAFLVKFSDENDIQILVPKPANALYLDEKDKDGELTGKTLLVRLEPRAFNGENELCGSDLPNHLLHIQIEQKFANQKGKPAKGASFWTLEHFIQWQQGKDLDFDTVNGNLTSIPTELRTHVAIDDDSLTSADGMLFQTASFDLAHQKTDNGWQKERLGFVVQTTEDLKPDLATFGGERRLSHFKRVENISLYFEPIQNDVVKINQAKGFSVAFITPCIFEQGALPAWIKDKDTLTGTLPNTNIKVQLKAMAIERWQAVSGWDSVLWQPKATRRAVAAGSVYWFEIVSGQFDLPTLQKLSCHIWSDNDYDKYDGFGSAILSAWQVPQ